MINVKTNDFFNYELKKMIAEYRCEVKDTDLIMDFIDKTKFLEKDKYYWKIETLSSLAASRSESSYSKLFSYFERIKEETKAILENYILTKEEKKEKTDRVCAIKQEYNDWSFIYQHAVFKCALLQLQSELFTVDELLVSIEPLINAVPNYYQKEARVLKGRIIKNYSVIEARKLFEGALILFNSADACSELAYLEMEQGNYDRAITLYKSLKSKSPDLFNFQRMTRINLSRMYIKQKQYDLAEAELLETLEKGYAHANVVYLELGKLYFAAERYDEARGYYLKLLNNSNNEFDIVASACDLAILEKTCGNINSALEYVDKIKKYRDDNYTKLIEAKVFLKANREAEAYDILWKMVYEGSMKDRLLAADEILRHSYGENDYETAKKALTYLKDSTSKNYQFTYDFYTFLLYYSGSKTYEAAVLARKIYRTKPGSIAVFKAIVMDELINERYEEAERLVNQAEEKNELNPYQVLSVKALVYYYSNQVERFNDVYNQLLAIDDDNVAEPLYYLGRELYHYDYNLAFKCFEKARGYESTFHTAINLFYAATMMPENEKQFKYKIDLINELLSDEKIAKDRISIGRLKISLLRTYLTMQEFDKAKVMAADIIALDTDPFFVNDAKLALSIIYRIELNSERSYELAKEVYESEYFRKHAYLQMIKSMYMIDQEKAHELYNTYSLEQDRANIDYEYAVLLIRERKLDEAIALFNKIKSNKIYRPFLIARCNEKLAIIEEIIKQGNIDNLDFGNEKEEINCLLELK